MTEGQGRASIAVSTVTPCFLVTMSPSLTASEKLPLWVGLRQRLKVQMSSHNRGAGGWRFRDDLCPKNGPSANRLVARPSPHMRDRVHLDWNGTFLKLPETDVN